MVRNWSVKTVATKWTYKKNQTVKYTIIFIVIVFSVILTVVQFNQAITKQYQEQAETLLVETTKNQKLLFQTRIEGQFQTLASLAKQMSVLDLGDNTKVVTVLQDQATSADFSFVGFADTAGNSLNSLGQTPNLSDRNYFQNALQGRKTVSDPLKSKVEGRELLVSAVPIENNGEIIGIVFGGNFIDELALKLTSPSFNEESFAYIVAETGEVISGINTTPLQDWDNLFEKLSDSNLQAGVNVAQVQQQFANQGTGTLTYTYNDVTYVAYYEPLGVNTSYIFSVVPESEFHAGIVNVTEQAFWLTFNMVAIIVILFIYILYRTWRIQKMVKNQLEHTRMSEMKYKIAIEQSETLIFEYLIVNNHLTIPTKMRTLFGIPKTMNYTPEQWITSGTVPTNNQAEMLNLFTAIRKGTSQLALSTVLLDRDGIENWYDIYLTTIFDSNGRPQRAIGKIVNVEHQRQHTLKLMSDAQLDPMTRLYNKKATQELIEATLLDDTHMHAFILIDIDDFKTINDSFGHQKGDEAICGVANILRNSCRESDIVGRIGGDEFVVFLKNVQSRENIERKAQLICEGFGSYYLTQTNHKVSGSIGIAIAPTHGTKFQQLYENADTAMYHAKKSGKDQYQVSENDFQT